MSYTLAGRSASGRGETLEKGRVAVTKVRRYWKGRAPEWVEEESDAVDKDQKRETAAPVIVSKTPNDPRLERLSLVEVDKDAIAPAHRRMQHEAQSVAKSDAAIVVKEEEEGEEAVFQRRAQLRLKLLEARKDEPSLLPEQEEGDEEESSDEYESSEEEDGGNKPQRLLMKPVFVSVDARETIQERTRLEEEEEHEWEVQKQKLQQRMQETRDIVSRKIREEEEALQAGTDMPTEAADIITDDDADEEDAEFESWKQREMDRIKRDKEEILTSEKYAEEREKLKNMTEEEREIYEMQHPKVVAKNPKKKWKFLQKYWHKGAYYQEEPDDIRGTAGTDVTVFGRDFSDPTGEDKVDKSMLPKIMQVKNFGRSGRTKWTHLVNEDTTQFDDPWTNNDKMRAKYNRRMAASDQEFHKPKKFKS